jgi:hypothetical protein
LCDKELKLIYYEFLTKAEKTINPTIRKHHIRKATLIIQQLNKEGRKIKGINCPNY